MLDELLKQPHLWQGHHYQGLQGIKSGFVALDQVLPNGGWPQDGLIEVVSPLGMGELSLLLPALCKQQNEGTLAWLNPPWRGHGPELAAKGLNLSKLLFVQADKQQQQWAAEEILKSPACSALVFWPHSNLSFNAARRLQMLCLETLTPCFVLSNKANSNTPCSIRLEIKQRNEQGIEISLLKGRGIWGQPQLQLPMEGPAQFCSQVRYPCFSKSSHPLNQQLNQH